MSALPQGWTSTTMANLCEIITKGTTPTTYGFEYQKDGVLFVKIESIDELCVLRERCAFIGIDAHRQLNRSQLQENDILFSIAGTLGRVAIVSSEDIPANTNQALAIIRLSEKKLTKYISRFLCSSITREQLSDKGRGTGLQNLNLQQIGQINIDLPPLAEQRRIVAKLDSLFARTRRSREELSKIPQLIEHYKQAILSAAFRGDLTKEWRGNHSIQQIKTTQNNSQQKTQKQPLEPNWFPDIELPSGWVWHSVDQLALNVQYGSSAKTSETLENGVAVIRMGNLVEGVLDFSNLKYLPINHDEFTDLLLIDGDVLFNRTNSAELVGKTAVYRHSDTLKASFASYLIRIQTKGIIPELLSAYINSPYGREWVASVVNQQVGQANVNGTKLRQLAVPVMSNEEQSEIWKRINEAFAHINTLHNETKCAQLLLDHLDQAYLAKAFRGELVPQDPNDEPASILLERIRAEREAKPTTRRKQRNPDMVVEGTGA